MIVTPNLRIRHRIRVGEPTTYRYGGCEGLRYLNRAAPPMVFGERAAQSKTHPLAQRPAAYRARPELSEIGFAAAELGHIGPAIGER